MQSITRQVVPLTAALALGWLLAQVGYHAGEKVSSSETQIASLSARVDGITTAAAMAATHAQEDHDKLTTLINQEMNIERTIQAVDQRMHDQAPIKLDVSGK